MNYMDHMTQEDRVAAYQEDYEAQREAKRRNRSRRQQPFRCALFVFAAVVCAMMGWWIAAVIFTLPAAYLAYRISR